MLYLGGTALPAYRFKRRFALGVFHASGPDLDQFVRLEAALHFGDDAGRQSAVAYDHYRVERMGACPKCAAFGGCEVFHLCILYGAGGSLTTPLR